MKEDRQIERDSFYMFLSKNILQSRYYKKSTKRLSFSYRYEGDQEVFAFVSLKKEEISNYVDGRCGCKILEFFFEEGVESTIREQLYEETRDRIKIWILTNQEGLPFDYLWFELKNGFFEEFKNLLTKKGDIVSMVNGTNIYFVKFIRNRT